MATVNLLIQGKQDDFGRVYHPEIQFPNGQVNILKPWKTCSLNATSDSGVYWCNPQPRHKQIPNRFQEVLNRLRLVRHGDKKDSCVFHTILVRNFFIKVYWETMWRGSQRAEVCELLDRAVVEALEANLGPDGEDRQVWYKDPGLQVRVKRLDLDQSSRYFDADSERSVPLSPEADWVKLGLCINDVFDLIEIDDALRIPRQQLQLMSDLSKIEGVFSYRFEPGESPVLVVQKGPAWKWRPIMQKLRDAGLTHGLWVKTA